MSVSEAEILGLLSAWAWPFFRITAAVSAAPVFGNRSVPARVKLALALALTLAIAPALPPPPALDPTSGPGILLVAKEVFVGLAFGFALRLALLVMELAGQLVAHLMGLGFAALVDPQNGIDVPVLSQLYIVLATLVFLGLDGHLVIVATLAESFRVIPVAADPLALGSLWQITGDIGWVFAAALRLALPAIVTLLIVNLAFGVISRAAPQLHIIVIGFPMTLVFGFVVILLTYGVVVAEIPGVFEQSVRATGALVEGLHRGGDGG